MKAWQSWYEKLKKPSWTPDGKIIGTIWTVLYPIIIISFGWVFYQTYLGAMSWLVLTVFSINLIANMLFSPIEFWNKNLRLASFDIFIVWATIIGEIILSWPYSKVLSLLQLPYLIWVTIAMMLQFSITWRNRNESRF